MRYLTTGLFAALAHVAVASFGTAPAVAGGGHGGGNSGFGLMLGGAAIVKPKYEGSDEYEVVGVPIIAPRFNGGGDLGKFGQRFSFNDIDDIRFRVLDAGGFEIGPVAGYRSGRDEDDSQRLGGLGDIDGGLVLGGYVGYRYANVLLDASAATAVSGDDSGLQLRLGAEVKRQVSQRVELKLRVGTTYASDDYMQTYFGITPTQAAASTAGLAAFEAEAGFKDVYLDLGTKVALTNSWTLSLGGRYARLLGDAADSPVVETEDQFSGRASLTYKFSLRR